MVERRSSGARESNAPGTSEEFVRPRELPAAVYGLGVRGRTGDPQSERLLRRFLVVMELGWQAWVQSDGEGSASALREMWETIRTPARGNTAKRPGRMQCLV